MSTTTEEKKRGAGYVATLGCMVYFAAFIALTVVTGSVLNHWWYGALFFVIGVVIWTRIYQWGVGRTL